ncbi:Alpha/Beta hydrolase protein, partial [Dipodascopsis uninucleata]
FTEERIEIPVSEPTTSPQGIIVATLTVPKKPFNPPSAVVIAHGFGGHRNYCYLKILAHRLADESHGLYSIRFDFRNCGESSEIKSSKGRTLQEDLRDLDDVINYIKSKRNLEVLALIGHSRGALASLWYAVENKSSIPFLVNCSGRYRTELIKEKVARTSPKWQEEGGFWAEVPRYLTKKKIFIPAHETNSLAQPTLTRLLELPYTTTFLTIYGLEDQAVSVDDAAMFHDLLGEHRHSLHYLPDADHNFYSIDSETKQRVNHNPKVVDIIANWISEDERQKRLLSRS